MPEFANIQELETRLWSAADELRANTGLTSQEYSRPVLGLIFLRYAEYRFELAKERLEAKKGSGRRRKGADAAKTAIQAEGALLPAQLGCKNILKRGELHQGMHARLLYPTLGGNTHSQITVCVRSFPAHP